MEILRPVPGAPGTLLRITAAIHLHGGISLIEHANSHKFQFSLIWRFT